MLRSSLHQCGISQFTHFPQFTHFKAQRPYWHTASYPPFHFGLPLKIFKTRLLGRGFHTLIKKVSFSSPMMYDPTIHPLRASILTRTPPRIHPSISGFLKIFKTRLVGRSIHTLYKKCFVLLSNRCGITQSTPRGLTSLLAHRLVFTAFRTQPSCLFDFCDGEKLSVGFMELLGVKNGEFKDYCSEVVNPPDTPNSSSISSPSTDAADHEADGENPQQQHKPCNNPLKVKRKKQKREKGQRFAFMTKSEVDHLEDGYRWRKYGQKAVKNSPFPRYLFYSSRFIVLIVRLHVDWREE